MVGRCGGATGAYSPAAQSTQTPQAGGTWASYSSLIRSDTNVSAVAIYARGGAQFDADKELRASKNQLLELLRAVRDQQTTDRGRVFKIGLREWVFDEQDETCCVGKLRQSGKTATPKNLQVRRRRLVPRASLMDSNRRRTWW
jgi:hypothetical protein